LHFSQPQDLSGRMVKVMKGTLMGKYRLKILDILLRSENEETNLSNILNDKTLIKSQEDIDEILTEICNMAALKLIEVIEEDDPIEGRDLKFKITELGKIYLKSSKNKPG